MHFVAFDINGREGAGGTEVLAGSAAYAFGFVDSGNISAQLVVGIQGHHLYGSRGAVARAVVAVDMVVDRYAVLLNPHGMTYLYAGFIY